QMLVAHIALVPLAEDDPLPTPVAHLLSDSGEVPVAYEGGPELEHEAKPKNFRVAGWVNGSHFSGSSW
ncbi:hypothetical protein QP381_08675, partial [Pauljensenia sp. UMB6358]|uniref:hypothetical protein n=1 Tax=Pauljensenia sp. UMB6358 TaxID=3046335 RepID=UPI00254AD965